MKNIIFSLSAAIIMACNQNPKTEGVEEEIIAIEEPSLSEVLSQKLADFEANAPADKIASYNNAIEALRATGIEQKALQIGDTVPDFDLVDANGNTINLYETLKTKSVLLTWYRGGWCPYCNLSLQYLEKSYPAIKEAGATILALSPEVMDSTIATSKKSNLSYSILSDFGNKVGKEFGVVYQLDADVAERYQKGFGLHDYNGDKSNELPLSAAYIIGKDKVIKYAYLNADYRLRAEPKELLLELQKLK